MNQPSLPLLLFSLCLALSACGGGDDSGPVQSAAPSPSPSPSPPSPPPTPQLAAVSAQLNSALVNGSDQWPAGSTASGGRGKPTDGVPCVTREDYHVHAHLTIVRDGKLLALPPDIGLQGCAYELHTHDRSGILHIEAAAVRQFTLGQFFSVWGQPLERNQLAGLSGTLHVYLNDGAGLIRYDGDPRSVELRAHRMVYLVLGTPPAQLPAYHWAPTL